MPVLLPISQWTIERLAGGSFIVGAWSYRGYRHYEVIR